MKKKQNKSNHQVKFFLFLGLAVLLTLIVIASGAHFAVLSPKGIVASKQRSLIFKSLLLMLVGVIPVLFFVFSFAWRYRASNKSAVYKPNWKPPRGLELGGWIFLAVIIAGLGTLTWQSAHELDPYKPIDSAATPITIQVVALRWKWLFIYPQQNIATVNFVEFPQNTPVHFELTSDAPMNSFWIPQLGGQMYAMAGMVTNLNLMANESGEFAGSAAEINGEGFSGMNFKAKSTSYNDFNAWISSVKHSPMTLTANEYNTLIQPSENNPSSFYASVDPDLFSQTIMKYMHH